MQLQLKKWLIVSLSAGAAALLMLASCDEESALAQLGSGCLLNSDCDPGLACVYRRCHIECKTSADCPLASDGTQLRCVIGDKPTHVCQLEEERDCAYHSECPGSQVCGPDGQCRDECLDDRDCVEGQICLQQGVCADEQELDENGRLNEAPPPPEQKTGFPCSYDSQCLGKAPPGAPEFVCREGGCNYACYDNVDCEPNFNCEPNDGDPSTPGSCVLVNAGMPVFCTPGTQIDCQCWPDNSPGVQVCKSTGEGFDCCTGMNQTPCGPPGSLCAAP
jgi:hypothetical protein